MPIRGPIHELPTHQVANQPTHLENYNLFDLDVPLAQAVNRYGAEWSASLLQTFGKELGLSDTIEHGRLANSNKPQHSHQIIKERPLPQISDFMCAFHGIGEPLSFSITSAID